MANAANRPPYDPIRGNAPHPGSAAPRSLQYASTDVRTSTRREWATFRSPDDDRIYQLYWWQLLGVYILGRYEPDGRLTPVGQFLERDAAIAAVIQEPA